MSEQYEEAAFIPSLKADLSRCKKHAQRNSRGAHACYLIAIVVSGSSAVAVFSEQLPKLVLAFFTALPGIVMLINSVLVLEPKTRWFWKKVNFYNGLLQRVEHEGLTVADANAKKRKFDDDMMKEYPSFGALNLQAK